MAKHEVQLGKNKDGPYRISVQQYSHLKSKQARISIKNLRALGMSEKT